jgi:hypothetical protein
MVYPTQMRGQESEGAEQESAFEKDGDQHHARLGFGQHLAELRDHAGRNAGPSPRRVMRTCAGSRRFSENSMVLISTKPAAMQKKAGANSAPARTAARSAHRRRRLMH